MLPVHLEQDNQNTPGVLLLTAWWLDSEGEQIRWARGSCHLLGPSLQSPMGSLPLRGPAQSGGRPLLRILGEQRWQRAAPARGVGWGEDGARRASRGSSSSVASLPSGATRPLGVTVAPPLRDRCSWRAPGWGGSEAYGRARPHGAAQDARAWQAGLGATAAEALCGLILFLEPSNHPAAPAAREVDCPRSQARHPPSPAAEPGGRRALGSLTTLPEGTAAHLLVLLCVVTRKRRQKHSSPPFFSTEGCGQGLHTGLHFHSIKIFF